MGAYSQAENTPKCLKKFQPKMSAQAQKFEIFEKKLSLGVRSPWCCLSDLLFQQATTLQARSKDGGGLGTRFHFILKLTRTKLARAPQPIAARPPKILDDRK